MFCKDLILSIIEYNKLHDYQFSYNLNTNGVLIDDELIQLIVNNNVLVNVSLDGHKISNEQNRFDKDTFDVVLKNVLHLIGRKVEVVINYVITPNNVKYFNSSIDFFREYGINTVCLMINYEVEWSKIDLLEFKMQLDTFENCFSNRNNDFRLYPLQNKLYAILENEEVKKCNFGNENIVVSQDGKIYPCVSFVDDKNFEVIDGKLFDNTVDTSKCLNCKYLKYCVNNCMCRNRNAKSKFDVNCEFEKTFIDFAYKVARNMVKF